MIRCPPRGPGRRRRLQPHAATTIWAAAVAAPDFLKSEETERDFLEPKLLAAGSITQCFSPRGLGKTHVAHALQVKHAVAGKRVLLIDRDNSRREVKRRLRTWGADAARTLKVLTRENAPALTDRAAWAAFPFTEYDLITIDSIDSATEGVGEGDSAKPSKALASILDIAHREAGPAILVLGNTRPTVAAAGSSRTGRTSSSRCETPPTCARPAPRTGGMSSRRPAWTLGLSGPLDEKSAKSTGSPSSRPSSGSARSPTRSASRWTSEPSRGLKRRAARELIAENQGLLWKREQVPGKGGPKVFRRC